jgi:hypothetical protein
VMEAATTAAGAAAAEADAATTAAAAVAGDGRTEDAAGGMQACGWYGEHEIVRTWPLHPTEGPKQDAWLPYNEVVHNGKTYRRFKSTDPDFGRFSGFAFPSDGTPVLTWKTKNENNSLQGKYPAVSYKNSDELTKSGNRKQVWQFTHQAVALLWGATKRTAHPMSLQLVTDHIRGNTMDFHVEELQLITQAQNSVKDRDTTFPEGLDPIKPEHLPFAAAVAGDGRTKDAAGGMQACGWYGEHKIVRTWPLHPTEGPKQDAWLPYNEVVHNGKTYRRFESTDPDFGGFSGFAFPSDGTPVLTWKTKNENNSLLGKYPAVSYRNSDELTKSGNPKQVWQYTHQAVALLWGATKRTAHPMSLQVVTDHMRAEKMDFRIEKLQLITQAQNSVKDRDTTFLDGLDPIKPGHFAGGAEAPTTPSASAASALDPRHKVSSTKRTLELAPKPPKKQRT